MVQTYNEFRVRYYAMKEIRRINAEHDEALSLGKTPQRDKVNINTLISKEQTERGTVRISEQTANTNNYYRHSTGRLYELADEQPEAKKPVAKKIGRPKK